MQGRWDVLIIGAGNAAFCAALAAQEKGAKVLMLEAAPPEEAGGNSRFTAGAMRTVYRGTDDLRRLMPDLTDDEVLNTDFGTYTEDQFFDDLARVTQYRTNPDLAEMLVRGSYPTLLWMSSKGVRFAPIYGRQAFKVNGRFKFWGGLTVEVSGGGPGLIDVMTKIAAQNDIRIMYEARAVELIADDDGVHGAVVRVRGKTERISAGAVVLASGGFQSNAEWRTRYLGSNWELAKVRGTRFNMGDGIRMALEIGASPCGHWSGCHAVAWERNAPEFGDLAVGDAFQKHSYPWGIMINADGERFVDEGADFRNYTYAKYGRIILNQPGQFAWQVFDKKVLHLLRDEYRIKQVTKVTADTLEDLVRKLDGVDPEKALNNIRRYNEAVRTEIPFDPTVKDGRCTSGLAIPKSNWANTIEEPPFEAYAVTCGVTFSFGGLRIDDQCGVTDVSGSPIRNLYAAGELVGGIFYFNYPGGSGLTSGSVFGRTAGYAAAENALAAIS
jgi:tricarballylate dehydrogenase